MCSIISLENQVINIVVTNKLLEKIAFFTEIMEFENEFSKDSSFLSVILVSYFLFYLITEEV